MKKDISIQKVKDNHGQERVVYKDLPIGTKLKAKKDSSTIANTSGGSMTFQYLIGGKTYIVDYICDWSTFYKIPCVNDERNCVCWAEVHLFDII